MVDFLRVKVAVGMEGVEQGGEITQCLGLICRQGVDAKEPREAPTGDADLSDK